MADSPGLTTKFVGCIKRRKCFICISKVGYVGTYLVDIFKFTLAFNEDTCPVVSLGFRVHGAHFERRGLQVVR